MGLRIHGLQKEKKNELHNRWIICLEEKTKKSNQLGCSSSSVEGFEGLLLRGKDHSGRMRKQRRYVLAVVSGRKKYFIFGVRRQNIGTNNCENRRTVRSTARSNGRGVKHRFREDIYSRALQPSTSESKSG